MSVDIVIDDDELRAALSAIRADALALATAHAEELLAVPAEHRPSALNLLHYLALRRHDVRDLQRALAVRGLSSLGRAEGHVLATLDAVLARLGVTPEPEPEPEPSSVAVPCATTAPSFEESRRLGERNTVAALGPAPATGRVRLMVTLPSEAAHDRTVIARLADAGMDLARINCAHDDPADWAAMAATVRAEAERLGRDIVVACDLAGPKLRTGRLPAGPRVVRAKPQRALDGSVVRPARVRFVAAGAGTATDADSSADVETSAGGGSVESASGPDDVCVVPVDGMLLDSAAIGDTVLVTDTRGRRRRMPVVAVGNDGVEVVCDRTVYFATGTEVALADGVNEQPAVVATVGTLPTVEPYVLVRRGELLRLDRRVDVGVPARRSPDGIVTDPTTIGCELDAVFEAVAVGHRVLFDDGAIAAVVTAVEPTHFDVVVTRPERAKLKGEKGINLPDTIFATPALTDDDRAALDTVAQCVDLVSLSFVRSVDDIVELRAELDARGRPDVAVGLKLEHPAAFAALPRLLLHACQRPPVAVMLARGDLAIEAGFERLAEVQEQVLWMCAAAHVPVIWATQVAESLAKRGIPTRAEVTDAAWASRAECVMLNKGPHVVDAIRFLDDVFTRMHEHQDKGTALLRPLSISRALDPEPA